MSPGAFDGHMAAEAVTRAEHPAQGYSESPKSWGRTQFVGLALLVLGLVLLGVWISSSRGGSELDGTHWQRIGADGAPATAQFDDDRITGNGPVNLYEGPCTARDGSFRIGTLTRTERGADPALMQAEEAYFQALGAATRYSLQGNMLVLYAEDGAELLRFQRVE